MRHGWQLRMVAWSLAAAATPTHTRNRQRSYTAPSPHFPHLTHFRQVPDLVDSYMKGETRLDKYVTHNLKFDQINEAFELLHSGESLRTVLTF